jgi:hypothetical protein
LASTKLAFIIHVDVSVDLPAMTPRRLTLAKLGHPWHHVSSIRLISTRTGRIRLQILLSKGADGTKSDAVDAEIFCAAARAERIDDLLCGWGPGTLKVSLPMSQPAKSS